MLLNQEMVLSTTSEEEFAKAICLKYNIGSREICHDSIFAFCHIS